MNYIKIIYPKNPNLNHCPLTFTEALVREFDRDKVRVDKIDKISFVIGIELIKQMMAINRQDTFSLFFFSTQPEYIILVFALRCVSYLTGRDLKVYHQMHEPRYEPGRASLKISLMLYWSNWLMAGLTDKIILSSQLALSKGKTFIAPEKIVQINLTFLDNNHQELAKSLVDLKRSWEQLKTISLIGIAAKDKNPEGFLSLINIANRDYPQRTQGIRAGWDKNVKLDYRHDKITHFSGYLTDDAKKFLSLLTHIIVIPYHASTQSGVVVESLSYGKIVIVNDIPAFHHLKDLKSVFIVDFNDREKIANCLHQIFAMSADEYEQCYWESIEYFDRHNSVTYLQTRLSELFYDNKLS